MTIILPNHILKRMSPEDRKALGKDGLTNEDCQEIMEARSEKEIHNVFSDWLRLKGIPFLHSRMDAKSTIAKGFPDYTVLWEGRAVCIEFKMPGGKISEDQRLYIERLNETGTPAHVCYTAAEAIEICKKAFNL